MVVGSVDDDDVRRLLTFVMANGERFDPGTRLDCLDAVKARTDDEHVRNALVKAARTDKNDAVRLKALDALRDYTHEAPVRDALLEALHHDANPGVRVEAVNLLVNSLGGDDTDDDSGDGNLPAVATPASERGTRSDQWRRRRCRARGASAGRFAAARSEPLCADAERGGVATDWFEGYAVSSWARLQWSRFFCVLRARRSSRVQDG